MDHCYSSDAQLQCDTKSATPRAIADGDRDLRPALKMVSLQSPPEWGYAERADCTI